LFVVVENTSEATCTLAGYPVVRGTAPDGERVDIPMGHGTWFDQPGREETPATIARGERATVIVESSVNCEPQTGPRPYDFRHVEVRMPDGGYLSTGRHYESTCKPGVGAWHRRVPEVTVSARWTSLRVSIEAPSEVSVGSVLTYFVTITNTGPAAVALEPCPGYLQSLGPTKSGGSFALNCAKAPAIAAGQSIRFEMKMVVQDLPPVTGPVDGLLEWAIWDGPHAGPQHVRILP
jgi:hypothetical protein